MSPSQEWSRCCAGPRPLLPSCFLPLAMGWGSERPMQGAGFSASRAGGDHFLPFVAHPIRSIL